LPDVVQKSQGKKAGSGGWGLGLTGWVIATFAPAEKVNWSVC